MKSGIWILTAVTLSIGGIARAQTSFPETEPNDNKPGANVVTCMLAGDSITGTTTGSSTTIAGLASSDNFRTQTCALPLGVYMHRLTITTSGTVGHIGTIRGLTQTTSVINTTSDSTLQTSTTVTTPQRMVQWFAFGKQEELIFRVTGTTSTTAAYVATLTTAPLAPISVPGSFAPGPITINSSGQGHTNDTDLWLYDGNLDAIFDAGDDEPLPAPITARPAILTRALAAGTYTVAISNYNLANNLPAPSDDVATSEPVLDFPGLVTNSSTTTALNVSFSITDGVTTQVVTATKVNAFDVVFATFTIGTPPVFTAFCAGDGSLIDHTTPCPCGNNGAPGNGCGHSFDPNGANLAATGTAAADDVLLTSSNEPGSSFTLFMQHDAAGDVVFHDGVLCAGGTLIRLRGRNAAGGQAFFPNPVWDSSITLSQRGGVFPGQGVRRFYAAWYRNASTTWCPPATANVTNGWMIDW